MSVDLSRTSRFEHEITDLVLHAMQANYKYVMRVSVFDWLPISTVRIRPSKIRAVAFGNQPLDLSMKTLLTVISLWLFSAMPAHSAPAVTGETPTGVPMSVAKRLLDPMPATAAAGDAANASGIPMSRAKRLAESGREAASVIGARVNAQPSGVPLVVAKRR
ncbi:MAG: hypothetical protein ABL900_19600 [Burkholderiaceae bacterium]